MNLTALYDACVLYPAPLRDLLMHLAVVKVVQARWTDAIHDEWTRSVAANRPDLAPASLARCRKLMDEHVPDSLIAGYEGLIPGLRLPDPGDRHVLAAAIHGGADVIVTFNLKDFPAPILADHGIEAIHPDRFLAGLWEDHPNPLLEALRRPPKSPAEFLASLDQCGPADFVAGVAPFADRI